MARTQALLAVLGIGLIAGCDTAVRPVYLVGEASYTVVVSKYAEDTVWFYRSGDPVRVARPGDSLCVRFMADGGWETVYYMSRSFPLMNISWAPVKGVVENVQVKFTYHGYQLSTGRSPCAMDQSSSALNAALTGVRVGTDGTATTAATASRRSTAKPVPGKSP